MMRINLSNRVVNIDELTGMRVTDRSGYDYTYNRTMDSVNKVIRLDCGIELDDFKTMRIYDPKISEILMIRIYPHMYNGWSETNFTNAGGYIVKLYIKRNILLNIEIHM